MELDLLVDISNILIRGCFNTLHSRRYVCRERVLLFTREDWFPMSGSDRQRAFGVWQRVFAQPGEEQNGCVDARA